MSILNRNIAQPFGLPAIGIFVCLMIGAVVDCKFTMGQQLVKKKSITQKKFINPKTLSKSSGYSHAVVVKGGRTIYISGQVAQNAQGEIIGKGDLRLQTMQAFQNLKNALSGAGADFADVVKINIYVANYRFENLSIIREVRERFISAENPPASTLVGVESLFHEDLLIEIEAIAVLD